MGYIDIHYCTGSADINGRHIEVVQPRMQPRLSLSVDHQTKFNGNVEAFFKDCLRIDKDRSPSSMCWCVKNADPLCPGTRKDTKDLVFSLPCILTFEIEDEARTATSTFLWDFPAAIYPHTKIAGKNHSLVYDLVGLGLVSVSPTQHFIARYSSRGHKAIYTFDGMLHGGFPIEELKAKFVAHVAGRKISVPEGFSPYQAFYVLHGGLAAQQMFSKIRTQALSQKFGLNFDVKPGSEGPLVKLSDSASQEFILLPPSERTAEVPHSG